MSRRHKTVDRQTADRGARLKALHAELAATCGLDPDAMVPADRFRVEHCALLLLQRETLQASLLRGVAVDTSLLLRIGEAIDTLLPKAAGKIEIELIDREPDLTKLSDNELRTLEWLVCKAKGQQVEPDGPLVPLPVELRNRHAAPPNNMPGCMCGLCMPDETASGLAVENSILRERLRILEARGGPGVAAGGDDPSPMQDEPRPAAQNVIPMDREAAMRERRQLAESQAPIVNAPMASRYPNLGPEDNPMGRPAHERFDNKIIGP